MEMIVSPKKNIKGEFSVPGDKSISHRAVMFGAIASGITKIDGFLTGADCISTISCFRKLGIEIKIVGNEVTVFGKGLRGLTEPLSILDCGNSGTTIRLLTGLLAAQNFNVQITGDNSIQKRPMDRVLKPLFLMGAEIIGNNNSAYAPLFIKGCNLHGINYTLPVASAQVKSAIILASLYAEGETIIEEPIKTRDHTEIMLNYFGADIKRKGNNIICRSVEELYAKDISIPGDISSAAFLIVAAAILPNSEVFISNVSLNETRNGIITVINKMGANINILNKRELCGDYVCDIIVKSSTLLGCEVGGAIIPSLIDEIPIIAVAACFANGTTVIKDAAELKVKESNRIKAMVTELKKMGADICETDDGMIINGGVTLYGAKVLSYNDHRVAMSLAIAALGAIGETTIINAECVDISFPNFFDVLNLDLKSVVY